MRPQTASLGFAKEVLSEVARDLRFRLADAGLEPTDIESSGLGYANLLYMATVVVELARAREAVDNRELDCVLGDMARLGDHSGNPFPGIAGAALGQRQTLHIGEIEAG